MANASLPLAGHGIVGQDDMTAALREIASATATIETLERQIGNHRRTLVVQDLTVEGGCGITAPSLFGMTLDPKAATIPCVSRY